MKSLPDLKEQYEFLKEVESSSLQNCAADIINGYNRYLSGACGKPNFKKKGMKDLRIREYHCKKCGNTLDRDYNASINILKEGIRVYSL